MSLQIVFTDLDGTLVRSDKSISPATMEALRVLGEHGVEVVPSSGRSIAGIPQALLSLSNVKHAVGSDGASLYEVGEGGGDIKVLYNLVLDDAEVLDIWKMVAGTPSYFDIFSEGEAYVEKGQLSKLEGLHVDPANAAYIRQVRHEIDCTLPEFLAAGHHAERITIFYEDAAMRDKVFGYVDAHEDLNHFSSQLTNIEIVSAKASKGAALEWLCDRLGIARADSAALGDSFNDLSMIEAAGTGIAMKNATADVRAKADIVSDEDNDHDGWAKSVLALVGEE